MAIKICSECKGKVSDQAVMCPHCGFGMSQTLEDLLRRQKNMTDHQEIYNKADNKQAWEEKRAHKRIDIKIMIKVNQETAMLFNISKYGMKLASPFTPKTPSVDITLDNGEMVFEMKGIVRWVSSKQTFSNLIDFGVEITEAPPGYYDFIDRLLTQN